MTTVATPAEARRSGVPGEYKIRCVDAGCSDRYHYRAPKAERGYGAGRSHRSRY